MADRALSGTACSQFESLLEDYLDSSVNAADATRVQAHMQECAQCREAFETARMSAQLFRAAAPVGMTPDPGFSRTVMARIRMAESEVFAENAGFWQSLVTLGWRFAATAALALIALVAYDAGSARHAQPDQMGIRPIQTSDFFFASDPAQPPANRDDVLIMVAETDHGTH